MTTAASTTSVLIRLLIAAPCGQANPSASLQRWLQPQQWERDTTGPVISLGQAGAFDDQHIFAPCVAFENGRYRMWYCGSRGQVAKRVFKLGLATSDDGKDFRKHPGGAVYEFGDGKGSILTPTLLRSPDGAVLRENGKLRMWFSAAHFEGKGGLHTLHETTSTDGIHWSPPSAPQLQHVYAPTVIKENKVYRLWYTHVAAEPWTFRYAESPDGRRWTVRKKPVMVVDQKWEARRLFYPMVVKADGVYLMWYGSYWADHPNKTGIGLAISSDGRTWQKHPDNPVLRPDPSRRWESHYTTSQSVLRLEDGTWRIWYASRKKPPFVNKYFAINTAKWTGPKP